MKHNRYRKLRIFFLAVFAVCLILLEQVYWQSVQHRAQQEALKKMKIKKPAVTAQALPEDKIRRFHGVTAQFVQLAAEAYPSKVERAVLEQYEELYAVNDNLVGWLSIEGMNIDYPVLQNEDDEYYLHHDFYGEDSKYGCLYVKNRADVEAGCNFIIYGHNMKDGSMFGDLDLYAEEDFYRAHPVIVFDTLYEERTYDIVAVFRSQVYRTDDDAFKYYQFYEADTQEAFDDFYGNIKELSLYDTGVEAQFGDTFLTLSTCAYHVEDGRFVVVAKRTA